MSYNFLPPGMYHVERSQLYENLSERIKYLQQFLEFGQADIDILKTYQSYIKKLIPAVSEIPFKKILKQDITAQALLIRSTKQDASFDEDDYYGPDSKNMKNRAMFVRWYLTRMNSDPGTPQYWEYMNMVGGMHNGLYRRHPLTIDVIHITMLLGYLQGILTDAIIQSMEVPLEDKAPLVKAWGKIFWIQNDLFTKWHVRDGDDYDQQSAKATKLFPETDFSNGMKDDAGNKVRCPFAKVAEMKEVDANGGKKMVYEYQAEENVVLRRVGSEAGSIRSRSFRGSEAGSLKSPTANDISHAANLRSHNIPPGLKSPGLSDSASVNSNGGPGIGSIEWIAARQTA